MTPAELRALRKARQLHPRTEDRLKQLLHAVRPEGYALPEGWGVAAAHRTDLVFYLQDRHIVHFELFGSPSTVHRDVNMLFESDADVAVALILDEAADPKVAQAYFRAVPRNRFRWYWLSQFLDPEREAEALAILDELLRDATRVGGPLTTGRPTASVHPAVGAPFSRAAVRVTGFHPDHDFMVFWDPDGSTVLLGAGRGIDRDGTSECQVVIPHGGIAKPGPHMIRAVDSLGNAAVASFEVATAWPSPSLRAVPSTIKPGQEFSIVGGGAPRNIKLSVFLSTGHQGYGVFKVDTDDRGEFAGSFEFPWLLHHLQLMPLGRHKLSVRPDEGGYPYEAHTYIEVPAFAPPGVLEWVSGGSHKSNGIAVLRTRFNVAADRIKISMRIRNDRTSQVVLVPTGQMAIVEFTQELKEKGYGFECTEVTVAVIDPGVEIEAHQEFRRKFDVLPRDDLPSMRLLFIHLPFFTQEDGVVWVQINETFPFEIWSE